MRRNSFSVSGDYYVDIEVITQLRAEGYVVEPA